MAPNLIDFGSVEALSVLVLKKSKARLAFVLGNGCEVGLRV
jgi:hypothetical protein